jgi:hypothetical protein
MKRPWIPALSILLLIGCSAPRKADTKPSEISKLVGTWSSKVQFVDGPFASTKDLELLYSFNQGGTMTESSNYDGAPPVPPAYGIWRQSGVNEFDLKYVYYNTKAPAKFEELSKGGGWTPAGKGVLTEHIILASDGKSYDSTLKLEMFDQAGKPIEGGGVAGGHGTMLRF